MYQFKQWQDELGNIYLANPLTIEILSDKILTAIYESVQTFWTLNISATSGGSTNPTGAQNIPENQPIIVTAMPSSGYSLDHWTLDGVNIGSNLSVTVGPEAAGTSHALVAIFSPIPPTQYTLTVSTTTGGTTSPIPGTYKYNEGTQVNVTAVPNSNYAFDSWSLDGVTRSENPISISMNQNHSLVAHFTPIYQALTISAQVGGTTNPSPGTYQRQQGTTVIVNAVPDTEYNFDHWILDGVTYQSNPISVVMNTNHSLTAYFSAIPPPPPTTYKLTVISTSEGTTDPVPGIHEETSGSTVRVTATPQSGFYFSHWELDGVNRTENPIDILMDRDHSLMAVFETTQPVPEVGKGWIIVPFLVIGGIVLAYLVTRKK